LIEVCRIVESQSRLYAENATSTYEKALYIESVLEETKPKLTAQGWHPLLATPFRYPLPVLSIYQARFRPPFFLKNVLYASLELRTALYEHAYHYLRERVHLKCVRETGQRTIFSLYITSSRIVDLRKHSDILKIMDRHDYAASHAFIEANPKVHILRYPSCRDPRAGDNFAVFDIHCLAKHIGMQQALSFYFEPSGRFILWMDYGLRILWKEVS
jgi:hypothetical protein